MVVDVVQHPEERSLSLCFVVDAESRRAVLNPARNRVSHGILQCVVVTVMLEGVLLPGLKLAGVVCLSAPGIGVPLAKELSRLSLLR